MAIQTKKIAASSFSLWSILIFFFNLNFFKKIVFEVDKYVTIKNSFSEVIWLSLQ